MIIDLLGIFYFILLKIVIPKLQNILGCVL